MIERRQLTPFPGKQRTIWKSSLVGMEQPLRSFESFLRTAPPHPSPLSDKPLPAIPSSGDGTTREAYRSLINRPSKRNFNASAWETPVNWNEPTLLDQDLQNSSSSVHRSYAPLIPEPSPLGVDNQEQSLWPFTSNQSPYSELEPINEYDNYVPSPSSSPSPFHSPHSAPLPISVPENDCSFSMSSSIPRASIASHTAYPISSNSKDLEILSPSPISDVMIRSKISTNQKAFASVGIESTRERQKERQHWSGLPDSPRVNDEFQSVLFTRGRKFQPLSQGFLQDAILADDGDMDERLQQLGVSQDYYNMLDDQYYETHLQSGSVRVGSKGRNHESGTALVQPSKDGELMPRPLSWKKETYGSSPNSSTLNIQTVARSPPTSRKRHSPMSSSVPFHQPTHAQQRPSVDDDGPRSAGKTAFASRRELFGSEIDRLLSKEIHLSNLMPNVRGFRSHASDNNAPHSSSSPKPATSRAPSRHRPLDQSAPLFRLPGGLVFVRQSPTPTAIVRDNIDLDTSSPLRTTQSKWNSEHPAFNPAIDVHPIERRRSSLYSQQSESPVAPAILINRKWRSSLSSPTSPRSRSSTSSPPTSPLAHEIELPRTPPPIPQRIPPSPGNEESIDDERADSANEDEPQRRKVHMGIFDKARDARDTWKRHHKDAKHEILKQSIRILGPTDPGVAAAYVKRQGRSSGDGGSRVPGFMGAGFI